MGYLTQIADAITHKVGNRRFGQVKLHIYMDYDFYRLCQAEAKTTIGKLSMDTEGEKFLGFPIYVISKHSADHPNFVVAELS